MSAGADTKSWFDSTLALEAGADTPDPLKESERLWRGFMTARVMLGLVLLMLQVVIYELGSGKDLTVMLLCAGYCVAALTLRLRSGERPLRQSLDIRWLAISGVDIVAIAALQWVQGTSINYTPLFVLPILMTSVLGSFLLSMAGAAGVSLILLTYAIWMSIQVPSEVATYLLQAALSGAGCFVVAFLASQSATRLANVELRAQRSQMVARVQRQVNELVIESLTDGILVLDQECVVRAANPAAQRMLGTDGAVFGLFNLKALPGWQGLVNMMQLSFADNVSKEGEVTIQHVGQGPRRVYVRTQLTPTTGENGQNLCVMFLQDQLEMQARMRTEKLASMGRMSAAVAHEIRNPLSAIVQANSLLDEDLVDQRHRQLTQLVQQNAKRLEKIVEEVLEVSRVRRHAPPSTSSVVELVAAVGNSCRDWQEQTKSEPLLRFEVPAGEYRVNFEFEHLRRILVNLLDNARRFSDAQPDTIHVSVAATVIGQPVLRVWNIGQPLDQSVQRHLFEPFFSSESRSSGLGLYICRELCEEHGAVIAYRRAVRKIGAVLIEGNEFLVTFPRAEPDLTGDRQ